MTIVTRYVRFSTTLDAGANDAVHGLARALEETCPVGVREIFPAYGSVYLEWDDALVESDRVERLVSAGLSRPRPPLSGRDVALRVRYDGPDIARVAAANGLDPSAVAAIHEATPYRVFCIGAAPGQPFLGPNDARLVIGRHPTPRLEVPAHTVAIADRQSTVYPVTMPGGWNAIGSALDRVYDPHRPEPFLLESGDRVKLVAARGDDLPPTVPLELLPAEPALPALHVEEPGALDLVLDAGRVRHAQQGLAQTGPLDASAARLANALVGNAPSASLVETTLFGPSLVALRPCLVAVAGAGVTLEVDDEVVGWRSVAVRRGARLRVRPTGRGVRGYLAVAGGVESARFAGSASVDRRGLIGRPLRAGDVLGLAEEPGERPRMAAQPARPDGVPPPIRLIPGPQASPEATAALRSGRFVAAAGDRVGVRLEGPAVPGGELLSESPPLGAVQVTTGGTIIILLNDRLRTAGYAKPAVVHPADLGRIAQLRPGEDLTFTFVDGPAPRWYRDVTHE